MRLKSFKILSILVLGLMITNLWTLFPDTKVDLFLWHARTQELQWYIFDTTEMIRNSLLYFVIYILLKDYTLKKIVLIILHYSFLRIFDYWLYFNSNDILLTLTLTINIVVYLIYTSWKKE